MKKAKGKMTTPIKLPSLPPTTESLYQQVMRAHFQSIVWYSALPQDPPPLDPCRVR